VIEKVKSTHNLVDIMDECERWHMPIHNHGFVDLIDVMPRLVSEGQTADNAIAQAARVSYSEGTKQIREDESLIRYLFSHRHTSPFEMIEFKFHCCMPIFVARQWIRHRTASVNEVSARFSILTNRFFVPSVEDVRKQSKVNKQGGEEPVDEKTATEFIEWLGGTGKVYEEYEKFVEKGIARELARINLPLSTYTEWVWKIDMHNLLHFLSLRMDKHAQKEFRDYANAMFEMVQKIAPITCKAFMDYQFESMSLSKQEIKAIQSGFKDGGYYSISSDREQKEFQQKLNRLDMPYMEVYRETGIPCFECKQRSGVDCPGRKPDESTRCAECLKKFLLEARKEC
jgi:thymidylate synthase (FAD)